MLFRTKSAFLIDTVASCQRHQLPTVKAETPGRTSTFDRADDSDPDNSAVWQAAVLILQELCRLEGALPSRTVLAAMVRALKWLAAVAQLLRVRAEQDVLDA